MLFADDGTFPAVLADIARIGFYWEDDDENPGETIGIDLEPYDDFWAEEETADWLQAWTDNPELGGEDFRVFGQSADGGHAAIWLADPAADLEDQPVVWVGAEGDCGVVARDLGAYLWLLAAGVGPKEAAEKPKGTKPGSDEEIRIVAEEYAPGREQPPVDIVAEGQRAYPDFEGWMDSLCR